MSSEIEEIAEFRPIDLPFIPINSDFDSSEFSDLEDTTEPSTPRTPTTPSTPATPLSQLATSVTSFGFSDDDTASFSLPTPKRAYKKKRTGFQIKPKFPKRRLLETGTPSKKPSIYPQVRQHCRLPNKPTPRDIILKRGDKSLHRQMYVPHGSEVINMDILGHVISLLHCNERDCPGTLKLHKLPLTNGLQSYFILHCVRCHSVVAEFPSSLHLGETPQEPVNNPKMLSRRPNEIYSRALLAVHTTSMSWRDFLLVCALMDLPVPGRNLNQRSLEQFKDCATLVAQESMAIAAEQVRSRENTLPSNIRGALKCDVSFDATWHRRGHYSNQGFGAAIDIVSKKVLDFMLYQRVCRKCLNWPTERRDSEPEDYAAFWSEHKATCSANFSGSSQSMEGSAAIEIWKRSVDRNKLVYSTYVGDGDSSSFKNLVNSDPYQGIETVRKEECLGHVQKRLKKHLKKKSNKFCKISAGKVERVGQLYALVVAQNRGKTPSEIQNALWNLLDHLVEKHANCPYSMESWCYFQKARAANFEDPSVCIPPLRQPYLTDFEFERAKEVFTNFASLPMCGALTMGQTQNANESLHSIIWHHSPKAKYVGQKSIVASTALAVSTFNEGEMVLASVLNAMSISPSYSTLLHLCRRDHARNNKRDRAILESQKRRRRQLQTRSIAAESSRKRRTKTGSASTYKTGKFGTEILNHEADSGEESDTTCEICTNRVCPIGRTRKTDDWVGCDICERWFHSKCAGVNTKFLGADPYFCDDCTS